MDFFDIGRAPLYTAFLTSLLSGLLGGIPWSILVEGIMKKGIANYFEIDHNKGVGHLVDCVTAALDVSNHFRMKKYFSWQKKYIDFIKILHNKFAVGEIHMCTIDEMLAVTMALMDFGQDLSLQEVVELSVNYGRDNDTVASFCAGLKGDQVGIDNISIQWQNLIQKANPEIDITKTASQLSQIKIACNN